MTALPSVIERGTVMGVFNAQSDFIYIYIYLFIGGGGGGGIAMCTRGIRQATADSREITSPLSPCLDRR